MGSQIRFGAGEPTVSRKRDMAANCDECVARPEGLCPSCEWRLDAPDAYDRTAAKLRCGR